MTPDGSTDAPTDARCLASRSPAVPLKPKSTKSATFAIVSGGQTGVDRAALDAALEFGIPARGWCPRGRRAEDGRIPARYPLRETPSSAYRARTRRNVLDADATLLLTAGPLSGGTAYTLHVAERCGCSYLVVDVEKPVDAAAVADWIRQQAVGVLNVAGPRESQRPGIHARALTLLREVLDRLQSSTAGAVPT